MYAAELVEFVMNLVVDERLVVVGRVVTHDVVHYPDAACKLLHHCSFTQSIHVILSEIRTQLCSTMPQYERP